MPVDGVCICFANWRTKSSIRHSYPTMALSEPVAGNTLRHCKVTVEESKSCYLTTCIIPNYGRSDPKKTWNWLLINKTVHWFLYNLLNHHLQQHINEQTPVNTHKSVSLSPLTTKSGRPGYLSAHIFIHSPTETPLPFRHHKNLGADLRYFQLTMRAFFNGCRIESFLNTCYNFVERMLLTK
jgi:hypothetical protein